MDKGSDRPTLDEPDEIEATPSEEEREFAAAIFAALEHGDPSAYMLFRNYGGSIIDGCFDMFSVAREMIVFVERRNKSPQ